MNIPYGLRDVLSEGPRSLDRLWLRSASLMAGVLAVTSCGIGSTDRTEAAPTETVTATATATETVYEIDPTACALEGEPVMTMNQRLCAERRIGELTVVVVSDLDPTYETILDISDMDEITEATNYAADILALATSNEINLSPEVIQAPVEVADVVRERNKGECVSRIVDGYMSVVAEELMPEIADASQLVAFGGEACDIEGVGPVGGVAGLTHEQNKVDVYNRKVIGLLEFSSQTDVTRVGNVIAHELLHNYGLGHAGAVYPRGRNADSAFYQDPSGMIDLHTYLLDVDYQEYGLFGNVMSNTTQPMEAEVEELPPLFLNQVQLDYLGRGTDPGEYAPKVLPFQHGSDSLAVDLDDTKSPTGLSVGVTKYIEVGGHEFSNVNFLVSENQDGATYVEFVLSTPVYDNNLLSVASVASVELEESRPLTIDVDESTTVKIEWDGKQTVFTKNRR